MKLYTRLCYLFLALFLLLRFADARADTYLTPQQVYWAQQAFVIGEPYGLGYTLVGLEGQESSYCRFKGASWSRGCLGLKRNTARLFDPAVTRAILTSDNNRNLHDGLAYLLYCRERTRNWRHMVYAYHWGVPKASHATDAEIDADAYVLAVIRRLQEIRIDND